MGSAGERACWRGLHSQHFPRSGETLDTEWLRQWVAGVVVRAWESREVEAQSGYDKGKYIFKSITADETEFLFLMLCPCLDGLVDSAVYALNIARKQVSPLPEPVKDPMPACLLACGRLLTWYSNSMTPNMTRKQIMEEG